MNIKKLIFIFFLLIISLYFYNKFRFVNEEINTNLPLISRPLTIPLKYKWDLMDLNKNENLEEVYNFLKNNYLESGTYNIEYSKDLLKNTLNDYTSIALRKKSNNKIIGFISRIMRKVNMYDKIIDMFEIDFLSVDKKERNKYIAPLLIKEMERLCNYENKWARALFIINKPIPKYNLVTSFPGYIRPINIKKLMRANIIDYNYKYKYSFEDYKSNFKLEELKESDIPACVFLLNKFCKQNFEIFYIYNNKSFKKQYFDSNDVKSFVVRDSNGNITDFISYFISVYKSSSEINLKYATLNCYFNFKNDLKYLVIQSIIKAKKDNCDYMIASGLGNYKKFLDYCDFTKIYSSANLYTFNWMVSQTDTNKVFINFIG